MSKRLNKLGILADMKIDTKKIIKKANAALNAVPAEREIFMKRRIIKCAAIAAALTLVFSASVFAMTPAGQEVINSIISYFQSDKSVDLTSIEELEKHNEEIGVSVSRDGYTLTLDNLAIDDNFLHVFYTITNQEGKIWENKNIVPFVTCRINHQIVGLANNNKNHGYYADDYTYKSVGKYNISQIDVPDTFLFEMYSVPHLDHNADNFEEMYAYHDKLTLTDNLTLSEEDKKYVMYVSTEAKKASIELDSVTYTLNQTFPYTDLNGNKAVGNFVKAVFSPFGSQFIVKDSDGGKGAEEIMGMAMTDDNGNFLDILATTIGQSGTLDSLEEENSIEFIKGSADMKYFNIIPLKLQNENKTIVDKKIGQYPMTYYINEYGKVVITGITVKDGRIDVHYQKDGFIRLNPEFAFLDENGNDISFGEYCLPYYQVHHDTNSYTASYAYFEVDNSGIKPLPSDGSLSKEVLEQRLASIEVIADNGYTLDYANAIKVELK